VNYRGLRCPRSCAVSPRCVCVGRGPSRPSGSLCSRSSMGPHGSRACGSLAFPAVPLGLHGVSTAVLRGSDSDSVAPAEAGSSASVTFRPTHPLGPGTRARRKRRSVSFPSGPPSRSPSSDMRDDWQLRLLANQALGDTAATRCRLVPSSWSLTTSTACSTLVPHGCPCDPMAGTSRCRVVRCGFVAPRCRSWGSSCFLRWAPGLRSSVSRVARTTGAGPPRTLAHARPCCAAHFPTTLTPLEEFPSPTAVPASPRDSALPRLPLRPS
jgi:hypothetical protein